MLLQELTFTWDDVSKRRSTMVPHLYIAVPKSTIWQKDINGVWVFKTLEEADAAASGPVGSAVLDVMASSYLVPIKTPHGTCAVIALNGWVYKDVSAQAKEFMCDRLPILALSISESSARKMATQYLQDIGKDTPLWVYKTWNNDPSIFSKTDED